MTDKLISTSSQSLISKQQERAPLESLVNATQKNKDKRNELAPPLVMRIDEKIQQLKKKKEKIQTQQALLFVKEAQKIFKEEFSPDMALTILATTWSKASKTQKEEWQKQAYSFRQLSFQKDNKKAQAPEPTYYEN